MAYSLQELSSSNFDKFWLFCDGRRWCSIDGGFEDDVEDAEDEEGHDHGADDASDDDGGQRALNFGAHAGAEGHG
jgi:hypothetical protein